MVPWKHTYCIPNGIFLSAASVTSLLLGHVILSKMCCPEMFVILNQLLFQQRMSPDNDVSRNLHMHLKLKQTVTAVHSDGVKQLIISIFLSLIFHIVKYELSKIISGYI